MSGLALDTSGGVDHVMVEGCVETGLEFEWADLDAFTQGYVEALFASGVSLVDGAVLQRVPLGFSDLAPEALAQIIADCAARQRHCPSEASEHERMDPRISDNGRRFWQWRQMGMCKNFPPLTVSLGDDGKVHLREPAR